MIMNKFVYPRTQILVVEASRRSGANGEILALQEGILHNRALK
jgi:hypothetical protein